MGDNNIQNINGGNQTNKIDIIPKSKIDEFFAYFLSMSNDKENISSDEQERIKEVIINRINGEKLKVEEIFSITQDVLLSIEMYDFNNINILGYNEYILFNEGVEIKDKEKINQVTNETKAEVNELTQSEEEQKGEKDIWKNGTNVTETVNNVFDFIKHEESSPLDFDIDKKKIIGSLGNVPKEKDKIINSANIFKFIKKYLKDYKGKTITYTFQEYQIYIMEIDIERRENEEMKHTIMITKAKKRADELYEALRPIERRLENIQIFTTGLEKIKQIGTDKPLQLRHFLSICQKNQKKIKEIFQKLKKDKDSLKDLEDDEKIIRSLEREIVNAAKITFELFMRHIYRNNRERFTINDYDDFSKKLKETDERKCIKTAEKLEIFREKLFLQLLRKGIVQKKPEREKNYGLNRTTTKKVEN